MGGCLVVVAACSFDRGTSTQRDAPTPSSDAEVTSDAATDVLVLIDAPIDGPSTVSCTTSGLVCPGTATAVMCNSACWVKCQTTLAIPSQNVAAVACNGWGGSLAPIRNAGDQACVEQTLFPSQAHWIGFEQASTASSVTANWTWNSDGVAVMYTGWGAGQPNDSNGNEIDHAEQCAFMNTAGDWHDSPCSDGGLYRFSCRR